MQGTSFLATIVWLLFHTGVSCNTVNFLLIAAPIPPKSQILDGVELNFSIAFNGTIPGPTLFVNDGDHVIVKVLNQLNEEVSVHWHGLVHRHGTFGVQNQMDGIIGITQCGIPPGGEFTYEFEADSGTHWYHSHVDGQRLEGLFGAIIVKDSVTPFPVKDDLILLFTDWYHVPFSEFWDAFLKQPNYTGCFQSMLANGKWVYSELGNLLTCTFGNYNNTLGGEYEIFNVIPGEDYRLRIICAQAGRKYGLQIDGHNFRVIATDGQYIIPIEVNTLYCQSGETYDVIFSTSQSIGNYWFRLSPIDDYSWYPEYNVPLAILRYSGAGNSTPNSTGLPFEEVLPFSVNDASPLYPWGCGEPSKHVTEFHLNKTAINTTEIWTINGHVYHHPIIPYIFRQNFEVLPTDPYTLNYSSYDCITFEIINFSPIDHPMHLHGHHFNVLGVGLGSSIPKNYSTIGILKHTIVIPANGWAVLQFASFPGFWLFHCHVEVHAAAGMMMVIWNIGPLPSITIPDWCIIQNSTDTPYLWIFVGIGSCLFVILVVVGIVVARRNANYEPLNL